MGYRNLRECVDDLERAGHLVRVDHPISPHLEVAEVQRRLYRAKGPAVLFARPQGCSFPLLTNLFGTVERARFLFRDTLEAVRQLVRLKIDPSEALRRPWRHFRTAAAAWHTLPRYIRRGPVLTHEVRVSELPRVVSWPADGGPFVTLPLVYTEHPDAPGWRESNLGMYRVQLGGNEYEPDREVGLHYQIHRGIGVHHAAAIRRGEPLKVNVAVGGSPAWMLAAVMPLPENLPELLVAGALGGRRIRLAYPDGDRSWPPIPAEADFCICGTVDTTATKPEGPFGDHLGYYSLRHDFPVMRVRKVYHRPGAIWPLTVVGRPPQEDTTFGEIIHELTGPVIPTVIPGVRAIHAVDAAGVHPLLLAIGSERYVPYARERRPQELLTQANAILGQGQLSLAKYLFLAAGEDDAGLDVHNIAGFFRHVLERVDWATDLHFQTRTTIDTLDYSAGLGLNAGSKAVIAVAGPPRRKLEAVVPTNLRLGDGFDDPRVGLPGVLTVRGPKARLRREEAEYDPAMLKLSAELSVPDGFPLVVVVDDSDFAARSLANWLWVTFTRSDPASDVYGVGAFTERKHWGCRGPLVIDARLKPHHAPPLEEDPAVSKRVDALAAPGGPLHRLI
ncbi:MAG TPA: UbiD family decarboxylase [Gemmataceae bacterium]|nr:UbiD family decarboxylase [Gemmataceae bacterium]